MPRTKAEIAKNADTVRKLLDQGMSVNQISKATGMLYQTVAYIAKKPSLRKKPGLKRTKDEVKENCTIGIYFAMMAVKIGCRPADVIDVVRSAGVVRTGGIPV